VPYIVKSRGHTIGTTDLGFVRALPNSRMGWFQPNEAGERAMPAITSALPAVRAFLRSDICAGREGPIPRAELTKSTHHADLLEALHHVDALDLTLHHEDGTLIPTEDVGIQDTEQLLDLITLDDTMLGIDDPEGDDPEVDDPEIVAAREEIDELLQERFGFFGEKGHAFDPAEADSPDRREPWMDPGQANPRERYQIIVLLPEGTDLP